MKSSSDVVNDARRDIARAFLRGIVLLFILVTTLAAWIMLEISDFAIWTSGAAFAISLVCFFANLNFIVRRQRTIRDIERAQDRGRKNFRERE